MTPGVCQCGCGGATKRFASSGRYAKWAERGHGIVAWASTIRASLAAAARGARTCACGTPFRVKRSYQVHCSRRCQNYYAKRRGRPERECACGCGRRFVPASNARRGIYATHRCGLVARSVMAATALHASIPGGCAVEMPPSCEECGDESHVTAKCPTTAAERRRRHADQQWDAYVAQVGPTYPCPICGAAVQRERGTANRGRRRPCSDSCRAESARRAKEVTRATRKACKHRRRNRSRIKFGRYRDVDVFAEDGWVCVYCHRAVSMGVGPCAPNRATIDHWYPLNGKDVSGLDCVENVVTCCRECNYTKGAMSGDEFAVIAAQRRAS